MSQPESGGAARPRRGSTPLPPAPPAVVVILDSQVEEIDEGAAAVCALAPPPPAKRRKSGSAPSSAAAIDIITLDDSDGEGDAPRKGGGASRPAGKSPVADTAGGAARLSRGGGAPASQADDEVVCVGVVEPPASKQRAARDAVVDLTRDAADGVPLAGLVRHRRACVLSTLPVCEQRTMRTPCGAAGLDAESALKLLCLLLVLTPACISPLSSHASSSDTSAS
jgi:hypothetical protein